MVKRLFFVLLLILCVSQANAEELYVRPSPHTNGDGLTYGTAWSNFSNVQWGSGLGKVGPGDTLYMCGLWSYTLYGDTGVYGGQIQSGLGASSGNEVTIKSYDSDPAIVVTGRKLTAATVTAGDQEDGTYEVTVTNEAGGVVFEGDPTGSTAMLQNVADNATCVATDGSFHYWNDGTRHILINPYGEEVKDVYYNCQAAIDLNSNDYIIIDGISVLGASSSIGTFREIGDHCTVKNCTLKYNVGHWFGGSTDYTTIEYNTVSWSNGLYYPKSGGDGSAPTNYALVQHNTCTNMYPWGTPDGDSGCISHQGGDNNRYLHNHIETRGMCFNPYLFQGSTAINEEFAYNYCKITDTGASEYHAGIYYGVSNDSDISDVLRGTSIHHNIFDASGVTEDDGRCLRMKQIVPPSYPDELPEIYNNVIKGFNWGIIYYYNSNESGLTFGMNVRNNIFADVNIVYRVDSGITSVSDWSGLIMDYNIYPETTTWIWRGATYSTFANWKSALLGDGATVDGNSFQDDTPGFTNGNGDYSEDTDFQIDPDSSAYNAGTNIGLSVDYAGTSVPQGGGYDIGAYEYVDETPDVNVLTGVELSGVSMQ